MICDQCGSKYKKRSSIIHLFIFAAKGSAIIGFMGQCATKSSKKVIALLFDWLLKWLNRRSHYLMIQQQQSNSRIIYCSKNNKIGSKQYLFHNLDQAAVKQMKNHLRRVMGSQRYTLDAISSLLVGVEACLNSRPLSTISDDPNQAERR